MGRPTSYVRAAVVIDSHPMMRTGIVDALTRGRFDVVAHGAALADIRHSSLPALAVIVVGWDTLGQRDLEGLGQIMAAQPACKLVVLASSPKADDAHQAFAAGASAFILKTVDPDDLAALIRQVIDGNIIAAPLRDEPVTAFSTRLTPREKQVLSRVASGANNSAVAAQLWLSEATVKFHLRNIYRKLEANGRTEAATLARELGLIPRSHAH
jgi:DNA-binding NarL/FixJ family response regulator